MNSGTQQRIEGNWDQLRGEVKRTWGDLTDDDLQRTEGNYEKLVGVIKERTGEQQDVIEKRLDDISNRGARVSQR